MSHYFNNIFLGNNATDDASTLGLLWKIKQQQIFFLSQHI